MTEPGNLTYERDLFCLRCGYNLRGLSGDPVRCPECGNENPLDVIMAPAATIAGQLRRLETAPTLCVAAIVSLLGGCGTALTIANLSDFGPRIIAATASVLFVGLSPIMWRYGAKRFAESCLYDPTWKPALTRFVFVSLLAFPVVYGAFILGITIPFWFANQFDAFNGIASVVVAIPLAAIAFWFAGRMAKIIHRRATSIITPLQRKVAVRLSNAESPYLPPNEERD